MLARLGRALDRFEHVVEPRLGRLRRQAIHNDFNINNPLVDPVDPDRIAAVPDFGDIVEAPLIDDLAVAAAYQLDMGDAAIEGVAPFIAAYHAALPLHVDEVALLIELRTARLAMVVAISGWRAARRPDDATCLLRNNAISWVRLAACERNGADAGTELLRAACAAVAPLGDRE